MVTWILIINKPTKNEQAVNNLRNAYDSGFENLSTMTSDPDLRNVQTSMEFAEFMEEVNPKKKGIFGLF